MKSFARARAVAALLLMFVLLASPVAVLAKKGEKNYKRGLQHEQAQQWEKAAQEFALAVAANPSDTEYQLHYRRAIFNASQTFMTKGRALADQGDYVGAYNAFRQAYGYDPVNELAAQEMARVLRLQREKEGKDPEMAPTSMRGANSVGPSATAGPARANGANGSAQDSAPPARSEQLQTIQYSGELEAFIRRLADELNLNVVFDQNFSQVKRTINVRWKDITPARALDYIFMSQGLFFQKLDRRTILVADQSKRPQYQQLVLRTFYLYNIKPTDARQLLTGALPANAGRQPTFVENANTNSITVRDTPENIRTIEKLLRSVDKDRSEVVMEVSIYEVSRTDLLQLGNQIGDATTLGNLGGVQPGSFLIGGARQLAAGTSGVFPLSTGVGLLIPATRLSALSDKSNTRLIFSTQVHAFDDEKSETRIGEKVPVQTAAVYNGLTTAPSTGTPNNNAAANNVFGNGYPVIQYEDTGLVLDFKPKVYPNQDVQVTMNIETKDAKGGTLTPTFTQRKISGVARIPNGKTMMIASVAQDREEHGRTGLPLVGLIPILGRLFSTPTRNNRESDVVITMTPRVLRAPSITPEDEVDRPTGSMQTPQAPSLEAMIIEAEREEQLARARQLPTNQTIQLPAQPGEEVSFVPAPKPFADAAA
ncbi:MAG TPA: secretin N-terminal domain-containing protein, partial [Pyrinomonadaceae bacterium]|nr:secretin N-terminal domain-containing protein [Pyrinomonadaceae bacterium]